MKQVVLDEELRAKLFGGAAKVTLVDADGKKVGHYLPDDLYQGILDALVPEEDPRAAGIEDMKAGRVVTSEELLAGLHETLRRWDGGS